MTAPATAPALALDGGPKTVTAAEPAWPIVDDLDVGRMERVVRSGKWSWLGEHESAFCLEYQAYIGAKWAIALANGTVTLQCALQAVGVEPGHEVIVPGLTWVATAQAAFDIGADVVFADIDRETLCLDPAAFERAITPRTKAVIPVHLYGCMADMDAIMAIARRRGIAVVEDVAHQHGSAWRGVKAGAIGDVGSFSFQQSKVLTSGEGGAVTTNDDRIRETVFALKQVGWKPDLSPANRYGHNYRITEMQSVLLRGGLMRLPAQTARREAAAARFAAGLARIGGPLRVAKRDARVSSQAYYALTMHFDADAAGIHRNDYAEALRAEGMPTANPYWPVYRAPLMNLYDRTSPVPFRDQAKLQDYRSLRLPEVERACADSALLLFHTHLLGDDAYIDSLVEAVAKVDDALPRLRERLRAKGAA